MENIWFFLEATKKLGIDPRQDLFEPPDLFESKNIGKVVEGLVAFATVSTEKLAFTPRFAVTSLGKSEFSELEMNTLANKLEMDEKRGDGEYEDEEPEANTIEKQADASKPSNMEISERLGTSLTLKSQPTTTKSPESPKTTRISAQLQQPNSSFRSHSFSAEPISQRISIPATSRDDKPARHSMNLGQSAQSNPDLVEQSPRSRGYVVTDLPEPFSNQLQEENEVEALLRQMVNNQAVQKVDPKPNNVVDSKKRSLKKGKEINYANLKVRVFSCSVILSN
jgi:hypothetical protein